MLSPRHTAQLGLCATCLVLVSSLGILVAHGFEPGRAKASGNPTAAPVSSHPGALHVHTQTASISENTGVVER